MATGDEELFDSLRAALFTDSAIAGEGAAFAIGLLLLGQSDTPLVQSVLPDLLNYLHDTSHEKIIRALSLSIAMMVYGKEESADVIIEQLRYHFTFRNLVCCS
jgi:26S proteasome regulatory subunit N2